MNTESMLAYLAALEINNNREWFHANKTWYNEAKDTFETLVTALQLGARSFDPDLPIIPAKELTFRIMRDTHFSHDKRPYNAAFRAHIGRAGKKPIPCDYYVSLRPGDGSILGGGLFTPMLSGATQRVRETIAADGAAFLAVADEIGLPIEGEALKRVPREFDPALPAADFLRNKSWYVESPVPDALVGTPDAFIQHAIEAFARVKPLNDFLNRALDGFVLPF